MFVTNNGYYLRYKEDEIPVVGAKASGVKGINLKDDYVIFASSINSNHEYLNIFTNYKTIKRVKLSDLGVISRAKKGNMLFKKTKSKDYKVNFAYLTSSKDINIYRIDNDLIELKNSEIPIMDLASTGSQVKFNYDLFTLKKDLEINIEKSDDAKTNVAKEISSNEQLSFNDFVEDFKI